MGVFGAEVGVFGAEVGVFAAGGCGHVVLSTTTQTMIIQLNLLLHTIQYFLVTTILVTLNNKVSISSVLCVLYVPIPSTPPSALKPWTLPSAKQGPAFNLLVELSHSLN